MKREKRLEVEAKLKKEKKIPTKNGYTIATTKEAKRM